MRYSQVRAFHHVAICGGFSRAAEALGLTQPAISEQVRKLEADHDVLLFNRDRKQVTLTPVGERLLLLTRQLFEVEQQITDALSENRAALRGTLRIVADSASHFTGTLRQFRARHPGVFVSVQTGNTDDILAALRTYEAEIGVVGDPRPGPDMEVLSLGQSPIVAFAARGYIDPMPGAMTLAALAAHPLILREGGSKTRQTLQAEAARQGVTLDPAVEVEGREAVHEVVAAGAGIGFVSEAELGQDDRVVRIPLAGADLRMDESVVHLKQRSDVRLIRAFMTIAAGGADGE